MFQFPDALSSAGDLMSSNHYPYLLSAEKHIYYTRFSILSSPPM